MGTAGTPPLSSLQPPPASAATSGCTSDCGSTSSIVTTTSVTSSPSSTNVTNNSTSSGSKSGVAAFHVDVFNLVVLAALTILAIAAIVLLVIQRRRKQRLLQQQLAQRAAEAAIRSASPDVEAGGASAGASAEEITKRLGPALRWAEEEFGSGADGGGDGDEPPPPPPRGAAKWFLRKSEDELCCAVCLGEVLRGEWVRKLPACGHVFHQECVEAWLLSKAWCPLCRTELFPQDTNKATVKQGAEGGGVESVAISIPPGAASAEEEEELVGSAAAQGGAETEGTGPLTDEDIQRANSEEQVSSGVGATSTSISVLQSQTTALPSHRDG